MRGYGILNVNPSAPLLPETQDVFSKALDTAKQLHGIIGQHYGNRYKAAQAQNEGLEAQRRAGTLESDIGAQNMKNQTDIQYYPQMQAAKLAQEGATIKEIQAKTGLSYAQTQHALAMARNTQNEGRIGGAQGRLFEAYEAAPAGSPQKAYFGALLNKEMGNFAPMEGGMGTGMGNVPGTPRGGIVPGGTMGGIETNPLGGGPRAAFHQAFNPETGETMEAPTTASATRNQMRTEAHSEIGKLYPKVIEGLKPYQGPLGSLALINDSRKASKDKAARKRLEDYEVAKRFLPELASINARQATGSNPGIELTREYQNAMFPALPGAAANYFVPSDVRASANAEYLPTQGQAVESAINQERQGFQRPGARPPWAGQGSPMQSRGGFGAYGYESPAERAGGGFNGNPNVPQNQNVRSREESMNQVAQYQSMADAAIKAGADPEKVRQRLAQLIGGK
jgi:hypothetical protein